MSAAPKTQPNPLRTARQALGFTQEQLAAELEITPQHLSAMERGTEPVRRVYLLACEALAERAAVRVSENPPDHRAEVLLILDESGERTYDLGYYDPESGRWYLADLERLEVHPVGWRPLPPLSDC